MATTLGVPRETADGETRVALTPTVAERLMAQHGVQVVVEEGAGAAAFHDDAAYTEAGATVTDRAGVLDADVLATVAPTDALLDALRPAHTLVGFLAPLEHPQRAQRLADAGVTSLAMELVPRISRAQKMDALSAMSSLGGYRAALIAAHALPKFFPLLTTAAGTIRPARVLVLGAGVAGLQAIATAKRLGAKVFGYDIRDATREEVESLGATFVELSLDTEGSQDEGGYARALEKAKQERQPELLKPHVAEADVVITTALIPGRPAPVLINEAAVDAMEPGSVIVDLAAPNGGNCVHTEANTTRTVHDVHIFGPTNLPADMPVHASQLYSKTVAALIEEFLDDDGAFVPAPDDDVFAGACLTHDGAVQNDRVRDLLNQSSEA
ncbi:NAD(P) transhydrogenase subunit alpha [Salisaeta longa]|uniref:NAD(P) transhydrogenase subunit alpha n=1 Tax=Salisaeta longa TaxID=503170 RepID=UPI0003B65418|nr:NAD(P) transhydrogenase subunit alpha [Salisaeta longa]